MSNLSLVNPPFRVFPGDVEPVRGRIRTGPADNVSRLAWIQLAEIPMDEVSGVAEELGEDAAAEMTCCLYHRSFI